MRIVLISLSILLLSPNFLHIWLEKTPVYDKKEKFDPSLSKINSVEVLIHIADSVADANHISQGTLSYATMVATILRNRFYHGFSQYPLNENWIAAMSEHFLGFGLASIVRPDDILKYSFGGCSQQTIVLMEIMKRKSISYRSVGFPHHYASELNLQGKWYFFDPNMEPNITDSQRLENRWNCCADSLKKYYDTTRYTDLDWKFGKNLQVTLGKVDARPAPKAIVFQDITKYLSKGIWMVPLFFAFKRKKLPKQ